MLLALLPLTFSLLGKDEDTSERFRRALEESAPEVQARIIRVVETTDGEVTREMVIDALGGWIAGAHLPQKTAVHYVYGLLAAGAFFAVLVFLMPSQSGNPLYFLLLGLFTGTIGILLLFVAQALAEWTQGHIFISRNIVFMAIYWLAWAIGFAYRAAMDADMGFMASLLGFTFGVGLCEEVCKALPLLVYFRRSGGVGWREACSWGFASGVGFGVAEGIKYSADFYNGLSTGDIYLVRFVSCVALHAIWSAAAGVFIYTHQHLIQGDLAWHDWPARVMVVVAVPIVLHGLYDTALKQELNVLALITALASFGWLVWCLERARATEEEVSAPPVPRPAGIHLR